MVKGFILYREGRIPYVIEDYRLELFTDDSLLSDFSKEYNHQTHYILRGQYFDTSGFQSQSITIMVDYSIGNTCYLQCYLLESIVSDGCFDHIGFQSPFLDDVFRYQYNYLDIVRGGTNLSAVSKDVYNFPFMMNDHNYELIYRIGRDERLGLLGDSEKKGEVIVPLASGVIQEYYTLSIVLNRFSAFMVSQSDVSFKRITLYKGNLASGRFYCKSLSDSVSSGWDIVFFEFDVMKYAPRILNNIALDSGSKIIKSVPLGHLAYAKFPYPPQRFLEQITSFEYLFEKLEPKKAKAKAFSLKAELILMFDSFPDILSTSKMSSETVSETLKEVRRKITHGYEYYYSFSDDSRLQYMIIKLDKLIKLMSLKWIGFTQDEISEYICYRIP